MEQEQDVSPEYARRFNEGYLIARHMPDLAQKLTKAIGDSDKGKGFNDGREQFLNETSKYRYPSRLQKSISMYNKQNKDKSKDDRLPTKE